MFMAVHLITRFSSSRRKRMYLNILSGLLCSHISRQHGILSMFLTTSLMESDSVITDELPLTFYFESVRTLIVIGGDSSLELFVQENASTL